MDMSQNIHIIALQVFALSQSQRRLFLHLKVSQDTETLRLEEASRGRRVQAFPRQGHVQPIAYNSGHRAFEYLQGRIVLNVSGQPLQSHPHSGILLSHVQTDHTLCVFICAHCLLSCHWEPMRWAWLCFFTPFLQVFIYLDEIYPKTCIF